MAPPSVPQGPQRNHTTLENRLSQPESKKARKRRRKAERQALEDARLQKLNWLNGPSPFTSGVPILPLRSWSNDIQMYGGYPLPQPVDYTSLLRSGLITGFTPSPFPVLPDPDNLTLYDNRELHSVSPPSPPSRWVSSMAKAASDPVNLTTEEHDVLPHWSQWSPLSNQIPLPLPLPSPLAPPLPSHATNTPSNPSPLNIPSSLSKPIEYHTLPPKPPPPQPVQTTIGMKPDQDPNSKHGVFQLASATKEAGTDMKKKSPLYIPNPARTLVMEQLPKTHRHPDFINNWSKSACGAHPVHMFIDGPGGKALIEFATAELARKAWASPKLGSMYPSQVKGKPREDLIRVWWYRVDGVGAGSGVGEIEEGEIEGDAVEKDDQPLKKETKKEKKARLTKEREEKKAKRELELRLIKEQRTSMQQLQVEPPTSSTSSFSVPESSSLTPVLFSPPWSPILPQAPTQHLPTASEVSWGPAEWGRADSRAESWGPLTSTIEGQANDLDDYESNMDIDEAQPSYSTTRPAVPVHPLHSSLPPRPTSTVVASLPRAAVQGHTPPPSSPLPPNAQPVSEDPPISQVAPSPPPAVLRSVPSSSSSMPSTTFLPSEPRAMKNAPTEPSFTKRALMARQKELEERIAKSKLELAETRAATVSTSKPATMPTSVQLADNLIPSKPSMDLGEKQAMEDRLRKRVLQSQRAKGKTGTADNSHISATTTVAPGDVPSISPSTSTSSSSSSPSSVPSPVVPSGRLTTVSLSAHKFSLEDLAVSFITQTIETIKSQPTSTPTQTPTPTPTSIHPSNKPAPTTTQSNDNNTTKLELVAKQRRLEQHIAESKNLMAKLAQARTKEEKDTLLKAMREMTRCVLLAHPIYQYHFGCPSSGLPTELNKIFWGFFFPCFFWGVCCIPCRSFEEGIQSSTTKGKTSVSRSPDISSKDPLSTPERPPVRIWPGSHEDAGVLILSDSDNDDSSDED